MRQHRHLVDWRRWPVVPLLLLAMAGAANAQDEAAPPASASNWPDPSSSPAEILDVARIQKSLLLDAANARDRAVVVGDRGHILVSESRSEWCRYRPAAC